MRSRRSACMVAPMDKAKAIKAAKIIGKWIPAILLVLIFAPQGWSKFSDTSGWATAFRHWGYPDWFRVTIGVMEVGAVVLLLLGRTAAFGAILIIIVMLGGMATHIIFDGGRHLTSEVVRWCSRRSCCSCDVGRCENS